jgi:hypothetical protein
MAKKGCGLRFISDPVTTAQVCVKLDELVQSLDCGRAKALVRRGALLARAHFMMCR